MKLPFVVVLNDQHLEHPRQTEEGRTRQECERHPAAAIQLQRPDFTVVDARKCLLHPAAKTPDHKYADGKQRDQLDDGFAGDRDDDAVVPFVGIEAARPEKQREKGKAESDPKARANLVERVFGVGRTGKDRNRRRHRL